MGRCLEQAAIFSFCHATNILNLFLAAWKYLRTKVWIWLFGSVLSMFHVNVNQMNHHEENWGRGFLIGGIYQNQHFKELGT